MRILLAFDVPAMISVTNQRPAMRIETFTSSSHFGDQPARPYRERSPRDPCPDRREPRSAPHATRQATRRLSQHALRRHRREESARTCGPAAHEVTLHREPQSVLATHLLFSGVRAGALRPLGQCASFVFVHRRRTARDVRRGGDCRPDRAGRLARGGASSRFARGRALRAAYAGSSRRSLQNMKPRSDIARSVALSESA